MTHEKVLDEEEDLTPDWVYKKNVVVKWIEDDSLTYDRELLDAAWMRLYAVDRDIEVLVEVYDGGDCRHELYESGRIAILSYPGNSEIRELPPGAPRPKRGGTITQLSPATMGMK